MLPIFLICSFSNFACGDPCRQDSKNNVWCAPPGGDAKTNNQNQVVCGVDQCLITTDGNNTVMCSFTSSGGAMFKAEISCVLAVVLKGNNPYVRNYVGNLRSD